MKQKWLWTVLSVGAIGGIIWVLVLYLFGSANKELYDNLDAEAKVQLGHLCELQTGFFSKNGRYSVSLEDLGFFQDDNDGSHFVYEVGLADSLGFVARAFARKDYNRNQIRIVWEISEDCNLVQISAD